MKKFVDTATITVHSGNGGPGAVSFRREKFVPKGGPDGGAGGKGGDVVFEGTDTLQTLMDLKLSRQWRAKHGESGGKRNRTGANGADCIVRVPCGTLVYDEEGTLIVDITEIGQRAIVAEGGRGGRGNSSFSTSVNRTPRHAQTGEPGISRSVSLELRLIAKVGLIGLPNAGKSTLLNALTKANPKVGAYPFTTLTPNLGVLRLYDREIVIADIPGLIEGASTGSGLGSQFLRHVDRTEVLVHLVSLEEDPDIVWQHYTVVRDELAKSEHSLSTKPHLVITTKSDTVSEEIAYDVSDRFESEGISVTSISSFSGDGIENLIRLISEQVLH